MFGCEIEQAPGRPLAALAHSTSYWERARNDVSTLAADHQHGSNWSETGALAAAAAAAAAKAAPLVSPR